MELAFYFLQMLQGFLGAQVQLAARPSGPGFTDLVGVPLFSSFLTGGLIPFGLTELALFVVPLLSMSMLAGERGNGTLPLFFSAGLSPASIIVGKYLALMSWLVLWLALTLAMPLSLAHTTHLDWGKLASASLGMFLLLASFSALGLACSTFASHPAIAASAAIVITLLLWIVNLPAQKAGIDNGAINWLAMPTHLEPLLRGLVSTTDVVWFVLLTALALALATRRLSSERERG
jgi:ABC-type Na+ efflux pump, permease component